MKGLKICLLAVTLVFLSISAAQSQTNRHITSDAKKRTPLEKTQLPKDVTARYHNEYPQGADEKWYDYEPAYAGELWKDYDPYALSVGKGHTYVVEFDQNTVTYTIVDVKGKRKISAHKSVSHRVATPHGSAPGMPAAITSAINRSQYKDWKIGGETMVTFRDEVNDQVKIYKVTIADGGQTRCLYYQLDGSLLRDVKSANISK